MIGREQYLESGEIEQLLRVIRERRWPVNDEPHKNAYRDHAFFALLANLGMRPGELLALAVRDFHLEPAPWLRIRRLKRRRMLGVIDDLPLSAPLARVLKRWLEELEPRPTTPLFPITLRQAERLFRFYCERAGLPPCYHLYCLRHSAATRALRISGNLREVQVLLGHASVSSTQIYTHVPPEQRRALVDKLGTLV